MFMLAFHIVAIGLIVVAVWAFAYKRGQVAGERRLRRRLGLPPETEENAISPSSASAVPNPSQSSGN